MAKAGVLQVKILGDTSKFEQSMKGLKGKVGGAAKAIGKAGALGFAAVGTAAVTGAFKVAEFGDEVAKSSQKAGLGVEQFQELRFAFGQGGVEAATFDTAMQKFNKRLGESATTGGTADDAFKALGISLRDADGNVRDASGAMDEALPKLAAIESDAERAAIAGDLFGQRAGPELAAALADGVGGIDEAREKAQELGIVMSEDSAEAAEKFTDQWDDIKQSALGLLRSGLTPVMGFMSDKLFPFIQTQAIPALKDISAWFKKRIPPAIESARSAFEDVRASVEPVIRQLVENLKPVVEDVFGFLKDNAKPILIGLGAAFAVILSPIGALIAAAVLAYQRFETFRTVVNAVVSFFTGTVIPAVQAFGQQVAKSFGDLVAWVQEHWGAIQEAISHVVNVVEGIIRTTIDVISALWRAWGDDLLNMVKTVWGFIRSTIENAITVVQGIIETVLAVINGDWGDAWEAIQKVAGAVWDQIKTIVETAINLVKSILGGVLSTIQEVWRGAWDTIKSVASSAWDGIKRAISDAIETVLQFHRDLPGNIVSALGDLGTLLLDKGKALIQGLLDGIWNVYESLKQWFRDLPGRVLTAVGDLSRALWDAGRELIRGLIDGIKSMGSSVANAIKDTVPGGGLVGDALGVAIPGFHAGGKVKSGGLAVVGEKGPELVRLPRGARVHSNQESRRMAGSAGVVGGDGRVSDPETHRLLRSIADALTAAGLIDESDLAHTVGMRVRS